MRPNSPIDCDLLQYHGSTPEGFAAKLRIKGFTNTAPQILGFGAKSINDMQNSMTMILKVSNVDSDVSCEIETNI